MDEAAITADFLKNRFTIVPEYNSKDLRTDSTISLEVDALFAPYGKDEKLAATYRGIGNTFFRKKEFDSAIAWYNKAIRKAPMSSETLALAIGNRALSRLHDPTNEDGGWPFEDARFALTLNYPEVQKHKFYMQIGKARMSQGLWLDAIKDFECALENLKYLREEKRPFWKHEYEGLLSEAMENVSKTLMMKRSDSNDSEKREVKGDDEKIALNPVEKHLFLDIQWLTTTVESKGDNNSPLIVADRGIKIGERIGVDFPIAVALNTSLLDSHCLQCLKCRPVQQYPCENCSLVFYCDLLSCKKHQQLQHDAICKILPALKSDPVWGPVFTQVAALLVKRSLKEWEHYCENTFLCNGFLRHEKEAWTDDTISPSIEDLLKIQTYFRRRIPEQKWLSYKCAEFIKIFSQSEFWKKGIHGVKDEEKILDYIFKIALHLTSNLISYSLTIYDYKSREKTADQETSRFSFMQREAVIGSGFFVMLSRLKHSCNPNAIVQFDGRKATLLAIRTLKAGDAIQISFSLPYFACDAGGRGPALQMRFSDVVSCQCEACTPVDWSDVPEINETIKCPDCTEELGTIEELIVDGSKLTCSRCGKKCRRCLMRYFKAKKRFMKDYSRSPNASVRKDCGSWMSDSSVFDDLLSRMTDMEKFVVLPCDHFNYCILQLSTILVNRELR